MKKINSALAIAAAALILSATTASAQGLTRAEVKAQLASAQASGQLDAFDGQDSGSAYLSAHFHSNKPRSEVKDDVKQAEASGTLDALDGQDSGSDYLTRHLKLTEPRSEVKSQLATAEKNGTLDEFDGEDSGSFVLTAMRAHQSTATATASASTPMAAMSR
ncbi:MAG: DUF4148 domain-containing protein [Variovorax sp.]